MKRTYKKLLAFLLAALMAFSLLPAAAFAVDSARDEGGEAVSTPMPTGYVRSPAHGTQAVSDAYRRGDMDEYYRLLGSYATRDTLPSKYDSRDYNYVTSVKNQNPYGSCWAHAAMASVESYMIKFGIPVGTGSAATTSTNLSETQHCFFNYTSAYDAEGMLTGDKTTLSGSDGCLDSGGNGEMSAYTLQRWTGAASESVSALAYSKASTVASSGLNSQYAYGSNICHVQNSEWIPGSSVDDVKRAIMEYGAGNISYYETGNAYTYICTIDTSSQDSSSHKWANHAITVVGWDDSIAVSNFKPNKPSKTGAWICKNSWGTGYFSSGYCYISYEDTSVLEGYIYFYDAESIDNYAHNYQYDGTCNPVCYGKGWPSGSDYYVGFANDTKVANVFTAKGSECLKAIAFCNWDEAMNYTVEIYKNPTTGNPSSGTLMATQSGYLTFAGYYTIPLDTPVALAAGDTFSVVITQNVAVADDDGYYVHTPYDATFKNTDVVSWANWTHTNHGNTSYYKEPSGSWTDCPDNGDYRIKAYTDDVTFTLTAVSNNTAWGTVAVNGTTITCTPAAGYYVESCTVLSGTATCTINGNTVSVAADSDCTVQVNFAPKPTYTVNFVASGEAQGSQTAQVNDVITLPSSVSVNPQGWTFIGWMDHQIDETDTAPAYYAPGASYTVTGNTTLYAVYSRVEEGTGNVVYRLTDALENGGEYIIVDSNSISGTTGYGVGNTIVASNHYLTAVSVTINSDDTCTVSDANLPKVLWKATSASNGYTFYNEAVGKYMGLDSSEYLYPSATALAWAYTSDGYLDNQTDSEGYYYLSFDTTNTRYTTNKSGKVINLYKATIDSTTYYWTDPVEIIPEEYTVTFTTPEGVTPPAPMVMDNVNGGTLPTADAPEGYTFLGWVVDDYDNVTEMPAQILTGLYKPTADITLKALYTYSVSVGDVETGYYLVTDPASIAAGDKLIITANAANNASLSTTQNNNNRAAVNGVKSADYAMFEPAATTAILTVGDGTVSGSFSLYDPANNGYLYAASSSGNYLRTKSTLDANGSWVITMSGSEATLTAQGSYTRNILRYNSSSNLFSCYASGQQTVFLYRYEEHEIATPYYTTILAPIHQHTPAEAVIENEVPATCTTDGSYDTVVYCSECGEELSRETITVPATGHAWGEPTYIWAADNSTCTATRICANDASHTEAETVNAVVTTTAATCEEAGLKTYTATFTNAAFQTQTKTEEIPATGHTPGETVIENNVDPTCEEAGSYDEVVYCTVCGKELSRNTVTVPATGHTPGETVIENNVDPTCEEAGSYDEVVYCTVCGKELSRETVTIPATGHTWGEPTYEWSADNGSVTAKRVCANDATHVETETAEAAYEIVTEPTTESEGLGRYTAVFQNTAFESQTKDVVIPKLSVEGYHILVTDYTAGNATTGIEAEALYSGEVTFTVSCDNACLVAIDNGNDTYTVLTCTTTDDEHSFTVNVANADVTIVIAIKGDANLNGEREAKDATFAAQAAAGKRTFTALQQLAMDGNGDGVFDSKDATYAAQVQSGKKSYKW